MWLSMNMVCLHPAPPAQLSGNMGSEWSHNTLWYIGTSAVTSEIVHLHFTLKHCWLQV